MTDHALRAAERAVSLVDDGGNWARLASARARGGDASGAFAAACTALVRDPGVEVRDLLPPPPCPSEFDLRRPRTSLAVSPAPSQPLRVGRLDGPPLVGDRVVDLGRGLVAYVAAEGLVGVDLFGRGLVWGGERVSPWAVHAGRLVAVDDSSRLQFLDPATGEGVGRPLSATDMGLPGGTLRCLGVDERQIAVTTLAVQREARHVVVLDAVEGRVTSHRTVSGGADLAVAVGGVLLVDGTRRTLLRHLEATRGESVVWTADVRLAGAVDGLVFAGRWPGPRDPGAPALLLLRAADGAVVLEPPAPATMALIPSPGSRELVRAHVVGDVVVAETQLSGLTGLDRRTWATLWTWSPGRDPLAPRRAHLLPFTDLVVAVVEHEENEATQGPGPARRADAVLALNPSTGEEWWRIDLSPPVVMAGDPTLVAGRIVIPEWRGTAVVVGG